MSPFQPLLLPVETRTEIIEEICITIVFLVREKVVTISNTPGLKYNILTLLHHMHHTCESWLFQWNE
jgi:hypothetical protein